MQQATIRLQEVDGTWQTLGADRASGIVAEGLQLTSNSYGPDTASFELHRNPGAAWPDLAAFTPVEIEVGNQLCWAGRIKETQVQDGAAKQLSVNCEGSQYALDDDQRAKTYIHRDLGDWKPVTDIAPCHEDWWSHGGTVEINDGNIWLGWRPGTSPQFESMVGIVLDLGENASYESPEIVVAGKATQQVLKYPNPANNSAGYGFGTTIGFGSTGGYGGTSNGMKFVAGTSYTTNDLVYDSADGSVWQCTSNVSTGPRPFANLSHWQRVSSPLSMIAGFGGVTSALQVDGASFQSAYGGNGLWGQSYGDGSSVGAWLRQPSGATSEIDTQSIGASFSNGGPGYGRYAVIVLYWYSLSADAPLRHSWGVNLYAITTTVKNAYRANGTAVTSMTNLYNTSTFLPVSNGQLESALKASDVIADTVSGLAPSITTNGVQATSTSLQHFRTEGSETARATLDRANSFHNYILRVDEQSDLTFKPQPTVPLSEVGAASGYEFNDQAASSADDIYSRVIVEAQGVDGQQLRVARSAAQLATATQLSTSGASTLTSDQQNTLKTRVLTDSKLKFNTTSVLITNGGYLDGIGTYRAGVTYQMTFNVTMVGPSNQHVSVQFGADGYTMGTAVTAAGATVTGTTGSLNSAAASNNWVDFANVPHGVNVTYTVYWTPDTEQEYAVGVDPRLAYFVFGDGVSSYYGTVNALTMAYVAATLAEARGLRRTFNLTVPGVQTTTTLAAIGDAWLYDHLRAQFRGSITCTGPSSIRQHATGDPVHPSRLLLQAGEIVRLNDRIDPDTGQVGRDARIASVSYDHDAEAVTLELDNRRDNLQTLLNRLGTV